MGTRVESRADRVTAKDIATFVDPRGLEDRTTTTGIVVSTLQDPCALFDYIVFDICKCPTTNETACDHLCNIWEACHSVFTISNQQSQGDANELGSYNNSRHKLVKNK